jgi:hypothetical protein
MLKKLSPLDLDEAPDDDKAEERKELMHQLYLMYQLQPRAALDAPTRRMKAAFLRHECGRLGVPIPRHLAVLHKGVHAHPDPNEPGNFTFTYDDPWESPEGPPPLFPDEDFSDLDAEASETAPEQDEAAGDALEKAAELNRWERKSLKAVKTGKRAQVSFLTEVLPTPIQTVLRTGLATADSPTAVRSLFDYARKMPSR